VRNISTILRNTADERTYHIANSQVIPKKGCAVICHGLVSASHLNGELGDVRDFKLDGAGTRLAVHFEKKSLKSAFFKPENLHIAFELPTIGKLKVNQKYCFIDKNITTCFR